jgi:hypothetical protein
LQIIRNDNQGTPLYYAEIFVLGKPTLCCHLMILSDFITHYMDCVIIIYAFRIECVVRFLKILVLGFDFVDTCVFTPSFDFVTQNFDGYSPLNPFLD